MRAFSVRPLSPATYVLLVAVQWLALTLALASVNVHASGALRDYLTTSIGSSYLVIASFVLAVLLGVTARSMRGLAVMTLAMCVVAAAILGAVLYVPAWQGITARSVGLQNYAIQHGLFIAIWTSLPALAGCGIGYLLGERLRRSVTAPRSAGLPAWWDRTDESEAPDA